MEPRLGRLCFTDLVTRVRLTKSIEASMEKAALDCPPHVPEPGGQTGLPPVKQEWLDVPAAVPPRGDAGEAPVPVFAKGSEDDQPASTGDADKPAFKFIDLFAGIGGMRLGFEAVGGKCIYTCEWDRFSQKTYRANFPNDEHEIVGDIRDVDAAAVPDHDVLLAGFPCQPFSIAGVSKKNALGRPHGFRCDTQGTLFFDVARIIEARRPRAFLLENVRNLTSHDRGRTFATILQTLREELGYHVSRRVVDAQAWVPQHRERILIAGFRDRADFDLEAISRPDPNSGPKLTSVLHPEDGSEEIEARFTGGPGGSVLPKYTLTPHLWNYLQKYAERHRAKGNGFGFGLVGANDIARTLSARYFKDGSEILVDQGLHLPPRRLTPRECARLMGFDELGSAPFRIPVSDTQAYRQFGNAVVVPAIRWAAEAMLPYIVGSVAPSHPRVQLELQLRDEDPRKAA